MSSTNTSTARKSAASLKPKKPPRSTPAVLTASDKKSKQKRVKMSYRVKMLVFALALVLVLMIYMFSFIFGTQIGITIKNISISILGYIFGLLSTLFTMTNIGVLMLAGEGLQNLFSVGPIAVVTCGSFFALIVSNLISLVVSLRRTYLAKQSKERKFLPSKKSRAHSI